MKKIDKNINRKYSFSEYDHSWKDQFETMREFFMKVWGSKALAIEHVGSTSIEGMKAKPIIDVLIIVEKMESFSNMKDAMTEAGYEWGENYIAPNTLIFFRTNEEGEKIDNIHICEKGSLKALQFISMRDYLRTHPEKVVEYSALKEKNVALYPTDYLSYRAAKNSFLKQLERDAFEWDSAGRK